MKQAEAEVAAAKAALDKARIDLAYTKVVSPILQAVLVVQPSPPAH